MKKRSLFAAVAMLIVSAILLTSATYAWFSSSTTATASTFSASVSNTAGAIQLSANGTSGWTNTLTADAIVAAQGASSIASTFSPVSIGITNDSNKTFSIVGGAISSGTFTSTAPTAGTYSQFSVYIRSAQPGTVRVTNGTWTPGTSFTYFMIRDESNNYMMKANGSDSYEPVINQGTCPDSDGNGIINSTERSANGGTVQLGSTMQTKGDYLDITFTAANQVKQVYVNIWAEGQDAQCQGAVSATDVILTLNFTLQGASTPTETQTETP